MSDSARDVEPSEPPRRHEGGGVSFDAVLAAARSRLAAGALVEAALAAAGGGAGGLVTALAVVGVAPYSSTLRAVLVALIPLGVLAGAAVVAVRRAWPLRHDLVVGGAL